MTTYYARLKGTAFCNPSRTEVGSDNTNVTGWPVTQAFIYCVAIGRDTRDPPAETFKLQWRVSGGSFADLGATGAMKYTTSTVLTNGSALTSGNAKVAVSAMTWQNGEEVEDGISASIDLGSDYYTEIQYGVDPADATVGSTYEFQVVGSVNGALTAETGSMLTVAVVTGTYSITAPYDSTDADDVPTVVISEALPVNISTPYDSVDAEDVLSGIHIDLNIDVFDEVTTDSELYTPVEVEEVVEQTIIEDVEIFFVFTIDTGEDIVITELCSALVSECILSVYDEVILIDIAQAAVSDLIADVEDSITVEDVVTVTNTEIEVSVYDEITVIDEAQGIVSDLIVDTYSEVLVSEFIEATVDSPEVSIFDTILVSEDTVIEVGGVEPVDISTEDSVAVSDDVLGLVSDPQVDAYSESTVSDVVEDIEVSEPAAGPTLTIDLYGEASCVDIADGLVSDPSISVYDEVTVLEYSVGIVSDLVFSVFDTSAVSEYAALLYDLADVSVVDSVVLEEYLVVEVPSLTANIFDSVSISEEVTLENTDSFLDTYDDVGVYDFPSVEVEGLLPDLSINVFSGCSISEYLFLEESDEEVFVLDLVVIDEYVQAYINIETQIVDQVSISEDIVIAVEVAADLSIAVVDIISVIENYAVVEDYIIDVNDSVTVIDLPIFESVLVVSVDDSVSIDSSIVYVESHIDAVVSDTVNCIESVVGIVSDLSISVYDDSTVGEYSSIYWFLAEGILVIDSDIIVPICTVDLMVPEIGIYTMVPTNELEMEQ